MKEYVKSGQSKHLSKMKLSQLQKNINRTIKTSKGNSSKASAGFFGDNDLLRKKGKIKFEHSLTTLLPYSHYDEEQDLYFNEVNAAADKDLKVNCGFLLSADPMVGISEEKIDILSNLFTDALPEGLIVQIINYASPRVGNLLDLWKKERTKEEGIYEELAQKRIDYFSKANWSSLFSRPFVIRDFRLYIAVWLDFDRYIDVTERLKDLREIFQNNLQNVGIISNKVYPSAFLSFQDEILNPKKSKTHIEEINWDRLNNLNIQMVDNESYFDIKKNRIELQDDLAVSSFSVRSYPELWPAWEMRNLLGSENNDFLRISCPFAQIFTFYVLSGEGSATRAMIKSTRSTQQASSKMRLFTPGIEEKARDWKFVLDHTQKGKRLLEAQYRILLFADQKKLAKEEETLKGLFKTLGWIISRDDMQHLPCFLSSLPFWLNEERWKEIKLMNKARTILSWTAANVAPFIAEYKGAIDEPQMMLIGKRGQPVFFNPFYSPVDGGNFNIAVVGKSGSGKSVFMQENFTSVRGAGGMVFIIDDGKSFKNSSQLQGGKFIEIKDGISINPFTMIDWESIKCSKDRANAVHNFFISLISQICRPINPINEDEKSLIAKATRNILTNHQSSGSLNLIADELLKVAKTPIQMEIAQSLELSLRVFTEKYNHFFTGQSDIKMDNKLVVFELSNIKGEEMRDLKSVVMMTLMYLIEEKIYKGDRKTPSSLIIDEAWDLLHGEGMKLFIGGYVRRIRKYGGNLVTGTQSINDYYKNPAARAVLENSQWKVFLAQSRDSIDYLKNHNIISMDRQLEEALKSLKTVKGCYSDVLIYSDSGWFVARLALDPFSIFLYSSTAKDVARLEDLKQQGLSISEAVTKMAQERGKL
jgi:conjugal transfer ATP-binding protein TraC